MVSQIKFLPYKSALKYYTFVAQNSEKTQG